MSAAWVGKTATEPMIFGVVLKPGEGVEGLTAHAIEKAAHAWMLDVPNVAKSASGGRVVSSMCAMTDMNMTDERGRTHMVAKGSWVIGVTTDDPNLLRRARSGELSFQPMPAPDAAQAAHAVSAQIQKQEATMPSQSAVYEEILKAAIGEQREGESTEAAVTRYVSENPDVYTRYRSAATPVDVALHVAFEPKVTSARENRELMTRSDAAGPRHSPPAAAQWPRPRSLTRPLVLSACVVLAHFRTFKPGSPPFDGQASRRRNGVCQR